MAIRLRQRAREYAYASGFGIGEDAEQRVLDGEAGVPPGSLVEGKLLAVQVAKNKLTPDDDIEAVKADYVYCVEALARYADIIVVNVSNDGVHFLPTQLTLSKGVQSEYTRFKSFSERRFVDRHPYGCGGSNEKGKSKEKTCRDGQGELYAVKMEIPKLKNSRSAPTKTPMNKFRVFVTP